MSVAELYAMADAAAVRNGLPPGLFRRVIQQESAWNPGAQSGAGAIGLAQLMPGTAADLGVDPAPLRRAGSRSSPNGGPFWALTHFRCSRSAWRIVSRSGVKGSEAWAGADCLRHCCRRG